MGTPPVGDRSVGKAEMEGGTFTDLCLRPDTAAMALNDAVYDGKADAGPFELLRAVEPLEGSKESLGLSHVESGAVVPDAIDFFAILTPTDHLHDRLVLAPCELEGVG